MQVSLTDAKGQLAELVRLAEAGEDVTLTRFGHDVVRLVPVKRKLSPQELGILLEEVAAHGRAHATPGPDGARSQDFLYGEDGMPA